MLIGHKVANLTDEMKKISCVGCGTQYIKPIAMIFEPPRGKTNNVVSEQV